MLLKEQKKILKNGTLKVFKADHNIKKIPKEWYSQILQHKQDFHIILQLLCLPFVRDKVREQKWNQALFKPITGSSIL